MSCIYGNNGNIFFPKLTKDFKLQKFSDIALNFLKNKGLNPIICKNEDEARLISKNKLDIDWPCLFTSSDTTGEKDYEEFYSDDEHLEMQRFISIGIINNNLKFDYQKLKSFEKEILNLRSKKSWNKIEIINSFKSVLPNFNHKETGKFLDSKM